MKQSRSPNTAAEVDRNILPVKVFKLGFHAGRGFGIAEVRVGGAEWVSLRSLGEDEILEKTAQKQAANDEGQ